jgi:hypothetical protein
MTDDSREVQHEPEVLEGEDDVPRMLASFAIVIWAVT